MADIDPIKPVQAPWPVRPRDEEARKRKPPQSPREEKGNDQPGGKRDDGTPHVDEYA